MYIDSRLQVSSQQALTATAVSTDLIDLGQKRAIGPGDPMWWVILARVAMGGTNPTLKVDVQTDDAANFPSATVLQESETVTALPVGSRIIIPMTWRNEQFLRLNYVMGGTSPTVTLDAFLTNQMPPQWEAFENAID